MPVKWLAFCGAVGRGVKLEDNVALRLDGFAVDERGLIAPFVEGFGDGWNQTRRAED